MPLTKPDFDYKYLMCDCGRHFNDYPGYYDHINDCPLLRCHMCLEWILDESKEHVCAQIKLTKLKHRIPELVKLLEDALS